ncbi:Protein ALTERED PHOSPHATE STARVATION RESPONSE 1 [Cardamine amara subsp. amara]|uniref:Protein ALTERED PHOSPHATE STARVATION RESPONSE 1 n=1 Tax=Cardamine amara subsp. amara TaxID=228776 RepID=A0ABD0Z1B5_CARAN
MGCTTSKLDDLPAVALCRDRCSFLESAIQQRYAFSESHVSYTQSLKGISHSLHQFINHHHSEEDEDDNDDSNSPKKAKPKVNHSDSESGHIEFDSDFSNDIDSLHSSPLHHHLDEGTGSNPYLHMNYMKNSSMPPSIVYEQRPSSPQRVYVGESSNFNYNQYPNSSNLYFDYGPGLSERPPPPPSPPREKVWDFLNPFETYYNPYTPSRDSREIREELGVPDLEEDDEVVKEVHGKQKFVAAASVEEPPLVKSVASSSGGGGGGKASLYQTRPSVSVEKEEIEHEVHVVEKKVVEDSGGDEGRRSNAAVARGGGGGGRVRRGVAEVGKEIEAQFLRAAESGNEIAVLLEVGKHPYGRKNVASRKLNEVTPLLSQPSTSRKAKAEASSSVAAPTYADIEAELALRSRNLSSTLHKIHLWEKKLYEEVKAEEKLRLTHEKKLRKLRRLDERGAQNQKVDSTRKLVRSLSSKIRIAIQVVDKISVTINKIRDEELWLQLNELIQGLSRMWKTMLECHQRQCEAIKEARGLGPIRSSKKLGDDHLEATRMLGHELINWIMGFSSWVSAQKGFVRGLNSWLMKCILYEPEETPDGIVPFSPGRIGAPLIFVICNQWEQALDRISEKEVIEAMRRFTTSVLHLWEQDRLETQEKMTSHGDPRNVDREEQRIQKEIEELERKMVLVGSGDDNIVYQSDTSNESLQGSLQRIFEAMERFTKESMRAYEDLLKRVEEESGRETDED